MARPEPTDLVQQIQSGSLQDFRSQEQRNLIHSHPSYLIQELYEKIEINLPKTTIELLDKGIQSACLGALYAFQDRDLDPFHPDHLGIFSLIGEDIKEAYAYVSKGEVDQGLWAYETFDYGIKQVYYLDWQLYLSKICY